MKLPYGSSRKVAIAACALLLITAAAASSAASEDSIGPIDRSVLLSYLADNSTFTLIDARSAEEYEVGHILGAVNVPHDAVDDAVAVLPEDRAAPLVVYCKTGKRASKAAERLEALGFTNVRVLGPQQLFWSDTAPMFNCGVPAETDPPSMSPVDSAPPAVPGPIISAEKG